MVEDATPKDGNICRKRVKDITNGSITVYDYELDADVITLILTSGRSNTTNLESDALASVLKEDGVDDLWADGGKVCIMVGRDFYK